MTSIDPAQLDQPPVSPLQRGAVILSRAITFFVYLYVLLVEVILTIGFFLLLLGANPSSSFVSWVYRSLDRAMRPFRGIFEPIELGTTGNNVPSVLETSVLFAMIVYGIVALAVHTVLSWLNGRLARIERAEEEFRRNQAISRALAATQQPYATPPTATQPYTPTPVPPTQPPSNQPPS
jgi:hypothetical protein